MASAAELQAGWEVEECPGKGLSTDKRADV